MLSVIPSGIIPYYSHLKPPQPWGLLAGLQPQGTSFRVVASATIVASIWRAHPCFVIPPVLKWGGGWKALSQKHLCSSLPQNSDSSSPSSLARSSNTIRSQCFCFSVFLLVIEGTEPRALRTLSRKDLHQPYLEFFYLTYKGIFLTSLSEKGLGLQSPFLPPSPQCLE